MVKMLDPEERAWVMRGPPSTESDTLLSVMVRAPVSEPVAVGVKVTLIVQEPPAATLPAQLSVSLKLALGAMLVMVSGAVPVLLRVIGCDPLVIPTF